MSFAPPGLRTSTETVAESESHAQTTSSVASPSAKELKIRFLRAAGLTSAQTGAVMGMSAGAVRVTMHRARAKRRARQQSSATQDTTKLGMADVEKISPFLKFINERPSTADGQSSASI